MKDIFPEYYNLDKSELEKLWKECLFVFDANVLLNLYRYSLETSDNLIEILNKVSDKIWIPHQFALEYQRNRLDVIEEQKLKYEKSVNTIISEFDIVRELFGNYFDKTPVDIDDIKNKLNESLIEYPDSKSIDLLRDEIDVLFAGKIGDPFDVEQMQSVYKSGAYRYQRKTPPGYADATNKDKKDPTKEKKFGDLIGWLQIIEKAKSEGVPIIFITSERKEDWWQKVKSKTVGPRCELLIEFQKETSGKSFHMYDMKRFLEYAKKSIEIDENTIDEVEKIENVFNTPSIKDELETASGFSVSEAVVFDDAFYSQQKDSAIDDSADIEKESSVDSCATDIQNESGKK